MMRSCFEKNIRLPVKVIDIYTHKVYIPTCCAPLTLGHKKKFDTVSCGCNFKLKRSNNKPMATKKGGKKAGGKKAGGGGGGKKSGGKKSGGKKSGGKKSGGSKRK
jgi:uncharacterized membrane protein YgcG